MEHKVEIKIHGDDDGFVGMKCFACGDRFKLSAADVNEWEPPDASCPLCGLSGPFQDFLPPEFWDVVRKHVENLGVDLLNEFSRGLERSFRGNKSMQFKKGTPLRKKDIGEIRQVPEFDLVAFDCCEIEAKVPPAAALGITYCPMCGTVRE